MSRHLLSLTLIALLGQGLAAIETARPNDVSDHRREAWAFTGATIQVDPQHRIEDATLLIREGEIVDVVMGRKVPSGFVEQNLTGRMVYPGLIDLDSGYGLPELDKPSRRRRGQAEILESPTEGAFNVNQAIRSEYRAADHFTADPEAAKALRDLGFGAVLTHRADGLARGSGALVSLGEGADNDLLLAADASAHYSFSKGSSKQSYPSSMMGFVALLRQTHLDADWYGKQNPRPFTDLSLEAWIQHQSLPQLFEVGDWAGTLRADSIGDELGALYIIRGAGDEYQRLEAVQATGASLILPLSFPEAENVDDPFEARRLSLADMKHWELAPSNPARLAAAGIEFALTSGGTESFWENLRRGIKEGLSKEDALAALTTQPASMLGMQDRLGSLKKGAIANFLVTSGDLFDEDTLIEENWVQGHRYLVKSHAEDFAGDYRLEIGELGSFDLAVTGKPTAPEASIPFVRDEEPGEATSAEDGNEEGADEQSKKAESKVEIEFDNGLVRLRFRPEKDGPAVRLSGWTGETGWSGRGQLGDGRWIDWKATRVAAVSNDDVAEASKDEEETTETSTETAGPGPVIYPFEAYGWTEAPETEDVLFRSATVWTNEDAGILELADVLVTNGKIAEVGSSLDPGAARIIDATGMHLTAGIIDEHSHIALSSVNDVATNSGMVRMADVVDSEDIDIYRNLAGGVTVSQLLHGSANPIGGQSAIVKLRWGSLPSEMLIEGADGFIKFALGENVKRSRSRASIRYPKTRMGVEQVFRDAFTKARDYRESWSTWNALGSKARLGKVAPRRDLAMETMIEILEGRRFITCHSYVQSEIAMLMDVAEDFDFRVNTFTHILEGYKVADRMVEHGVGGSTFADWWAYKWEVRYAIPYNAALMSQAGVTVAVNSDDGEMARRLNQEAAKAIKYGGMSEEEALKLVTLNPAKLLHLDDRMGSIRVGKDADLVLWTDNPLSIYAIADKTMVDGIFYYDREEDLGKRQWIADERARLIAKMGKEKKGGGKDRGKKGRRPPRRWECDSVHGYEYLTEKAIAKGSQS